MSLPQASACEWQAKIFDSSTGKDRVHLIKQKPISVEIDNVDDIIFCGIMPPKKEKFEGEISERVDLTCFTLEGSFVETRAVRLKDTKQVVPANLFLGKKEQVPSSPSTNIEYMHPASSRYLQQVAHIH